MFVVDAAAAVRWEYSAGDEAVGDGQAREVNNRVRADVEHPVKGVAVNGQPGGTGAEQGHALADQQFAAGQQDGAGDTSGVYGVPVGGGSQRGS